MSKFCSLRGDYYERPEIINLDPIEKLVMDFCVRKGMKNYIGIFRENRGAIQLMLNITREEDKKLSHDFFKNHPNLIRFCPDTHFMWIPNFYSYCDFGLMDDIHKQDLNKQSKEEGGEHYFESSLDWKVIYNLNNFVKNVKNSFRDYDLMNHPFAKEWAERNKGLLKFIEDELKVVKGNNRNFDKILAVLDEKSEEKIDKKSKVINKVIHRL